MDENLEKLTEAGQLIFREKGILDLQEQHVQILTRFLLCHYV
jgi:hypothetical protein